MGAVRDVWGEFDPLVTTAVSVVVVVVVAIIVQRVLVRLLRRAYWERVDRTAAARGVDELARIKRQKTLVTLLESIVRYGIYGTALALVIGLATGGKASALLGASVAAVIIGIAFQRFFVDVVSGALLLFEGHFAVGDVVTVQPYGVTGTVEDFSLRTTSLRTLGGDRVTVLNGSIVSFTRWSYGQREFRIELLARGGEEIAARVAACCEQEATAASSLWLRAPAVVGSEHSGALTRVVVSAICAPDHELLAERFASLLAADLGEDTLVGDVAVLPHYQPAWNDWRAGVLVRG